MVYYPLQLLQRVGVREVLLVTGQQHAGQFIDLLGNGRVASRGGDELLFDLDLSYKVQVEAGGIAQVVGMARDFAAGEKLVVCLGDNIFEHAQADAIAAWDDGALVFAKDVPDPENFGVVVYGDDGTVADVVEKAGDVDKRYDAPPSSDAIVGLYGYPPDVFDIIDGLSPSNRGELEITDVNRAYAQQGRLRGRARRGLVARRRQALGRPRRRRPPDRRDRSEQVARHAHPLTRHEDERGFFMELMRASGLPKPVRQANLAWSRQGVIRALHYHERGQDDLFLCLRGMVRVVVLDRETGEVFTEDIGDDNPVAIYVPGTFAHGYEALTDCLFCYFVTEEYDAADPDEHGVPWNDPRVAHLWSTRRADSLCARLGVIVTGAGGQLGQALLEAFPDARGLTRAEWDVTFPPPAGLDRRPRPAHGGVDERRRRRGRPAVGGGGERRRRAARRGARRAARRVVERLRLRREKRTPYVESDTPAPLSAYGRSKLHGEAAAGEEAWVVRSSWLFGATVAQLRAHDAAPRRRARRGGGRRRPARVPDVRRPSRRGDEGRARAAVRHVPRRRGRATARGRSSRRRSSRRRGSTRASAASRRPSSAPARRGLRTRCCAASAAPRAAALARQGLSAA